MVNSTVQKKFSDRISKLISERFSDNASQFARTIGVTSPTVKRWIDGAEPSLSTINQIVQSLDVDLHWLMTGEGSPDTDHERNYVSNLNTQEDNYLEVPLYDIVASAGLGRLVGSEDVQEHLKFPDWWFARRRLNANNICALHAKGDSMEPTIPNDALLLIDRSKTHPLDGRVYVLRIDDELYVKRVKRLPLIGGVQLISDNTDYKPIDLNKQLLMQENFFDIIGQVVHIGIDLPH